jgi:hypothetical protein
MQGVLTSMSDPPNRAGRGSLSGRWQACGDHAPNLRGSITIERDVPAGTRLWLTGWTRTAAGVEFVFARGGDRRQGRPGGVCRANCEHESA